MTLVGRVRSSRYAPAVEQRARVYPSSIDDEGRLRAQLEAWNREWQRLTTSVPYFKRLSRENQLPPRFNSWQEFLDRVPPATRAVVQHRTAEMTSDERPPDFTRTTGGSTAEPVQLPAWNSEEVFTMYDRWLARSWYGVSPGSRLFLLWGHSHLMGSGLKGRLNAVRRKLSDRLLGYYRFSAYDLRPEALREAARALIRFRPEYVVGYSVALDLFARANADLRDELRAVGLKVVIGTAESFPSPDSAQLLEDLFGCAVAMEYGSVETQLIAHTRPAGGYAVFWQSYFLEAERDGSSASSSGLQVRVTSLYPRCFPLVRYELGDEIELWDDATNHAIGIDGFKRVRGRCNDHVLLKDGTIVHSEAFTHAVRSCGEISGYQVAQSGASLSINYTARENLTAEQLAQIRSRLARAHPQLAHVEIKRVERLRQTIAGKTRMVIKD
jgi:phenylacetate-CoA ligase